MHKWARGAPDCCLAPNHVDVAGCLLARVCGFWGGLACMRVCVGGLRCVRGCGGGWHACLGLGLGCHACVGLGGGWHACLGS
eukprot:jgi/Mesvir1/19746/Mv25374-RA.1